MALLEVIIEFSLSFLGNGTKTKGMGRFDRVIMMPVKLHFTRMGYIEFRGGLCLVMKLQYQSGWAISLLVPSTDAELILMMFLGLLSLVLTMPDGFVKNSLSCGRCPVLFVPRVILYTVKTEVCSTHQNSSTPCIKVCRAHLLQV